MLALFLTTAVDLGAQTRVYRCTNSLGEIEFRQHPCDSDMSGREVTVEDRKTGWTPSELPSEAGADRTKKPRGNPRTAASKQPAPAARNEEQCWKKRQLLDEVNWKLRRGYEAGKGVVLRRKRKTYEAYIDRFCE
ncbi:MAG: hypothetical protein U9Q81_09400 [Pseudomonadota bacterium]|nr:hypothetical protein [Pseudomonadota bacterium]